MAIRTLYYVDDDQDDLYFFRSSIKKINSELVVHTFFDPVAFISQLKEINQKESLIFLDINMPGKSGFEVLKEIRSFPELNELPVIMISTSDDQRSIMISETFGANLYVVKPHRVAELQAVLARVLAIDWTKKPMNSEGFVIKRT